MRKDHTIKMEEIRGHQVIELVPLGRLNKAVIASCLPQHQNQESPQEILTGLERNCTALAPPNGSSSEHRKQHSANTVVPPNERPSSEYFLRSFRPQAKRTSCGTLNRQTTPRSPNQQNTGRWQRAYKKNPQIPRRSRLHRVRRGGGY